VSNNRQRKRLLLRLLLKVMAGVGVLMLLWVLFAAAFQSPDLPRLPSLWVDLHELSEGEVMFVQWRQHRLLVLHRTAKMRAALGHHLERERTGAYSVLFAVGELNCPLKYQAEDDEFIDLCDGSRYDVAGRVLPNQAAGEDLRVPVYRLEKGGLLLGASAQSLTQ